MSRQSALFGIESEYGVTALRHDGRPLERMAVTAEMVTLARNHLRNLPGQQSCDLFLGNGGRFYRDSGLGLCNAEYATPECTTPEELVVHVRAGDWIVGEIARATAASSRIATLFVTKCNIDYLGHTSGSHENYLLRRCAAAEIEAALMPHLVTRIIYTGAGGFDDQAPVCRFTLSPRVQHLTSSANQARRGIVTLQTRESHVRPGYERLHLQCGDGVRCDLTEYLRIGTTALIVRCIELGRTPGTAVALAQPLQAMRALARDPSVRTCVNLRDGAQTTAIAIQRRYLDCVERQLEHLPPWAERVCPHWRAVLDALERDPLILAGELDWPTKLMVFGRFAARRGFDWQRLATFSALLEQLCSSSCLAAMARHGGPGVVALLNRRRGVPGPRVRRALGEFGATLDDVDAFLRLRDQLFELDIRWGELGGNGVFAALERRGEVRRLVGDAAVRRARHRPPAGSRAHVRGYWVRRANSQRERFVCDWGRLCDGDTGEILDLGDPFATRIDEQWTHGV